MLPVAVYAVLTLFSHNSFATAMYDVDVVGAPAYDLEGAYI